MEQLNLLLPQDVDWASLVAQTVKNLPAIQEMQVWPLGWEDPLEKAMEPTPVFLPRKPHGWRSLVGYSPWSHKKLDVTERLHFYFMVAQTVKNLPAMQEMQLWSWVEKIPWRREWLPNPVFLPEEFHGQRSLVGYSPGGCKESYTTEQLTLFAFTQETEM